MSGAMVDQMSWPILVGYILAICAWRKQGKLARSRVTERKFPSKNNHRNKQCSDQTNDQEMVDQPKHIRSQGVHLETPKSQTTLTFSHERA
jgi:hypothetical protein